MIQLRELSELRNPLSSTSLYIIERGRRIKEPVTIYIAIAVPPGDTNITSLRFVSIGLGLDIVILISFIGVTISISNISALRL